MNKNERRVRIYLIPILATVTAITFWWVFREEKTYYWWLALVALVALAHYGVFWSQEKALMEESF